MTVTVSPPTGFVELHRNLNNLRTSQIPFAAALALTETAKAVREAEVAEVKRVFDRPTPFTLNAFAVVPATKRNLVAEVRYKDQQPYTGKHFLEVQAQGGPRPMKAIERRFKAADIGAGDFAAIIPARGAKLDAYGNWDSGQRNRVLSALGAQGDYAANTTDRSRKRNKHMASNRYYLGKLRNSIGIFHSVGDEETLLAVFARQAPVYEARFDFHGVARTVFEPVFRVEFERAMARAMATAR